MAAIKRRSSILILLGICFIILLSSGGFFTIYLTHTIGPDAEMINQLGIIRGSIQRFVKFELGGHPDNALIDEIDLKINALNSKKMKIHDRHQEIQCYIGDLKQSCLLLKEAAYEYRKDPSLHNRDLLLEKSEVAWQEANSMVLMSQTLSEKKVGRYRISFIFLGVNLSLGFLMIFLIKRYVKDTLEYLVNYDGLTKLYNRRFFNESLHGEILRAERYERGLSVIMFDIDHFKRVNDTYGHDAGDSVLKELSQLIQKNIRKTDILARLGGEEFAVIVPETWAEGALLLAEKLRDAVARYSFKHAGKITISLGITELAEGDTADVIYKRADMALYEAKSKGRNRSEVKYKEQSMEI